MNIYKTLTVEEILSIIKSAPTWYYRTFKRDHIDFYNALNSHGIGKTFAERLYNHCYPGEHKCLHCGSTKVGFLEFTTGYRKYCSHACQSRSENNRAGYRALCNDELRMQQRQEKTRNTCNKKYGGNAPACDPLVMSKTIANTDYIAARESYKNTCMDKYGTPHYPQNADWVEKCKQTSIAKYGATHYSKTDEYLACRIKTTKERYGVENVSQLAEIHDKQQKFTYKTYTFNSGRQVKVQGYEKFGLDLLQTEGIHEDDLIVGSGSVPKILYNLNGKTHRYYPDIYIPSLNKLIEVKSSWTYSRWIDINRIKEKAAQDCGFAFEFYIFSPNGTRIHL